MQQVYRITSEHIECRLCCSMFIPSEFFVAYLKFGLNQSDHLFESAPSVSKVSPPVVDASKSLVQTRVPQAMRVYLKAYGKHHGLKMEGLLAEVLLHFMTLRPDSRGLIWRTPQSHRTEAGAVGGWAQINVLIADDVAGKLAGLSMQLGVVARISKKTSLGLDANSMH
jgi:hypothetical protein